MAFLFGNAAAHSIALQWRNARVPAALRRCESTGDGPGGQPVALRADLITLSPGAAAARGDGLVERTS